MKQLLKSLIGRTALAAGVLLALQVTVQAQSTNFVVSLFNDETEVTRWSRWWGAAAQVYEFDPAVDANTNSSSGSLKATIEFDKVAHGGDNQFALVGGFPNNASLDGTTYTNLEFDLLWAPTSPKTPAGSHGFLEIGFRDSTFGQIWLPGRNIAASNGWMRIVLPINPAAPKLNAITGVALKLWSGDPNNGMTGTATFWLDNVRLIASTNKPPSAPKLSIPSPATPGLRILASGTGQYQRQSIRTIDPSYGFFGAAAPVTYSLTARETPGTNAPGFQTHFFLVPGSSIANFETSPDYNQPNVIFLQIDQNAAGGSSAAFRYKTNQANGNSMFYNGNPTNGPVGTLAFLNDPKSVGTWSLRFSNNTNVTLTGPSGTNVTFNFPAESAALFEGPMYVYFGIQPNNLSYFGKGFTFSGAQITGVANPINENFAGVLVDTNTTPQLDPAIWQIVAENAAGISLVPLEGGLWVNWSVPAAGFRLQSSSNLVTWADVPQPAAQIYGLMRTIIPYSGLTDPAKTFFRLIK